MSTFYMVLLQYRTIWHCMWNVCIQTVCRSQCGNKTCLRYQNQKGSIAKSALPRFPFCWDRCSSAWSFHTSEQKLLGQVNQFLWWHFEQCQTALTEGKGQRLPKSTWKFKMVDRHLASTRAECIAVRPFSELTWNANVWNLTTGILSGATTQTNSQKKANKMSNSNNWNWGLWLMILSHLGLKNWTITAYMTCCMTKL